MTTNLGNYSASAMAIIKCVQLPGLVDKSDFTCECYPTAFRDEPHQLTTSSTDSTADLVLWTW